MYIQPIFFAPYSDYIKLIVYKFYCSENEALQLLAIKTTASYNKSKVSNVAQTESDEIKIGTACRNSGCKAVSFVVYIYIFMFYHS